eukprot:s4507_g4.t2
MATTPANLARGLQELIRLARLQHACRELISQHDDFTDQCETFLFLNHNLLLELACARESLIQLERTIAAQLAEVQASVAVNVIFVVKDAAVDPSLQLFLRDGAGRVVTSLE